MTDIERLKQKVHDFSVEGDWDQFHDGKNLAIALSIEATELLEAFLWKDAEDVNVDKVKEELADVINYAFLIAHRYDLDVEKIVTDKMEVNARKYPVERSKGSAKKYNEL